MSDVGAGAAVTVERRVDGDDQPYTKEEFVNFYGGTDEWDCAEVWTGEVSSTQSTGSQGGDEDEDDMPAPLEGVSVPQFRRQSRSSSIYTRGVSVQPERKRILNFRRKSHVIMPAKLVLNNVSKEDADKVLLADGRDGSFFFRKSSAQNGSIVVSMCWEKTIHHFVINFPKQPRSEEELHDYLTRFGRKHSKAAGILLPGPLKHYIPHTISARNSARFSDYDDTSQVLDLTLADVHRGSSPIDSTYDDVYSCGASGSDASSNAGGRGHAVHQSHAPVLSALPDLRLRADDERRDSQSSTASGQIVMLPSDPIYDDFQTVPNTNHSAKDGDTVYAMVSKERNHTALCDAYADPQDALSSQPNARMHDEQPRPPPSSAPAPPTTTTGTGATHSVAATACPPHAPPPLQPKTLAASKLALQVRHLTQWNDSDDDEGDTRHHDNRRHVHRLDDAGSSGYEDIDECSSSGSDAYARIAVDDTQDIEDESGYATIPGADDTLQFTPASAARLPLPLSSLQRNKRKAIKNVIRHHAGNDDSPSETAI
eukprot:m.91645 g.91645  ORF g.91645 m.91645 type:complete len:540 (+) comp9917_c0_seq1:62-1681(+)